MKKIPCLEDEFPPFDTGFYTEKHGRNDFVVRFVLDFPELGVQFPYLSMSVRMSWREFMFLAERVGERDDLEDLESLDEGV